MDIADAIDYCTGQVRQYDLDRYLSALFAPEADRGFLFALYAFNIEIAKTRETVSEPMLGQIRLQWWRDAVAEIFEGTPRRHEVVTALAATVKARHLSRRLLERLIDAREHDLLDEPPATVAVLEDYCEATSSTLMVLALEALGEADTVSQDVAHHGGISWAIAGLLRSLPFHLRQRRHFLPLKSLADAGIEPGDLFRVPPPKEVKPVVAELVNRARGHMVAARRDRKAVPQNARCAFLHLTLADISLKRIESSGFDVFGPRIELTPPVRQMRLLRAALAKRY